MKSGFGGVMAAIVTPFCKNGNVDVGALKELVEFLLGKNVHGLFVCGTTGEGVLLSLSERKLVAETIMEQVRGRVHVVVHVGDISTRNAILLTEHARTLGVSAVASITPFYYEIEETGLEQHFEAISKAADTVPFFLYNIPGNTHHIISVNLIRRLLNRLPNLVGLKDSMGDLKQLKGYLELAGEQFVVFVGSDMLDCAGLELGAAGVVSSIAGVFPEVYVSLYNHIRHGQIDDARRCQSVIDALCRALQNANELAVLKQLLTQKGFPVGSPRAPLPSFDPKYKASVVEISKIMSEFKAERTC